MCRLFGIQSDQPTRQHRAFAALRSQSHEHKDGWGVARFDGPQIEIAVGLEPAHRSDRFQELGGLHTRALLAHIRLASVGGLCQTNAHPFVGEGWAFTHNGTIRRFAERRDTFEALLPERRRAAIRGQTDSERCFQLFLHLLEGPTLPEVARALAKVMHTVDEIFDRDQEQKSSTNFLVSNGTVMAASRRGRTLFTAETEGARMIASEPLWHDHSWNEVPEGHVVGVDQTGRFQRFDPVGF